MSQSYVPERQVHTAKSLRKLLRKMRVVTGTLTVHHKIYPACDYPRGLERDFRNLHCHRIVADVDDHAQIHRHTEIPPKPTPEQMKAQIARCANTGCTNHGCVKPIKLAVGEVLVHIEKLPPHVEIIPLSLVS